MTNDLLSATGRFETKHAGTYLQQLCKHFGHKVDVAYDPRDGHVALPTGPVTIAATDEALSVTVSAKTEDEITRAKGIIDNHLARFAFRENFASLEWY